MTKDIRTRLAVSLQRGTSATLQVLTNAHCRVMVHCVCRRALVLATLVAVVVVCHHSGEGLPLLRYGCHDRVCTSQANTLLATPPHTALQQRHTANNCMPLLMLCSGIEYLYASLADTLRGVYHLYSLRSCTRASPRGVCLLHRLG